MEAGSDEDGRELLRLAMSRPREAAARAGAVIAGPDDPCTLSYAQQALGIVLRDAGETGPAVAHLRAGLRAARACGRADREADVRATLGAALVMHGRTGPGLRELDAAVAGARGAVLATVLMRRAFVLTLLGRHEESLADLRRALAGIRRSGDVVWEARTLNNRANVELALGEVARAERDVRRAEELLAGAGQDLEAVHALHNRGVIAHLRGDLPTAFALYDRAAARYAQLGAPSADLVMDRCRAYLAARLAQEAVDLAQGSLAGDDLQPRHRAELELMLAVSALEQGDAQLAVRAAGRARRRFRQQGRDWWELRAELAQVRARHGAGERGARLRRQSAEVARRLVVEGADDAATALLLAGRLAASGGGDAHATLAAAGAYRRRPSSLVRAVAWQAVALDRELAGDRPGVLRACGRGLDALDEHRAGLGSSELRALASLHGEDLAATALRHALATGSPRTLLRWTERWRSSALEPLPVRPPDDPELAGLLAALRAAGRRLDDAHARGAPTAGLREERTRLEQAIRRRRLHLSGGGDRPGRLDLLALAAGLGDRVLVDLVDVDGTLHALVVRDGTVRRVEVGPVAVAVRAVERARFALRQAARGRPTALSAVAATLEAALLGGAAKLVGDGPVVLAPPGPLHHTPWGLLPALADRPVAAAPSALAWLRARGIRAPGREHVTLVAGPGLPSAGAEVAALSGRMPGSRVLVGGSATVERTLAALDGASVAHVAAHGRYRADSPTFSCLDLDDGPLTVHDIERLDRAPYRVVLSACDSGVMAPVGANALLGLAAALLGGGSAGVVCSVTEVNDAATMPLMLDLHDGLARGRAPDEVLLDARRAARGDVLRTATAASFTLLGV